MICDSPVLPVPPLGVVMTSGPNEAWTALKNDSHATLARFVGEMGLGSRGSSHSIVMLPIEGSREYNFPWRRKEYCLAIGKISSVKRSATSLAIIN
jgi:hypothetical protein